MKLLMHTCCAPCSVYCIKALREENIEPTLFWYNPNIHPYVEYKTRRDTLVEYAKSINVNLILKDEYGLDEFCKNVCNDLKNRCTSYCYRVRLEESAKYAKENGFDSLTTTLFVSIYQKHDEIKKICEEICKKYDLNFVYRDFRVGFREGQDEARRLGLYMQKYCGCIFSEEDRNSNHIASDKINATQYNEETEKRVRLNWDIPNLELKKYKNGNQEQIKFIWNLRKKVFQNYIEKYYGDWNEENQKKLFSKFMKENSKNIELIYLKNELIGYYDGKEKDENTFWIDNIAIKPEYQNKGIGTAILKEILFEHKEQDIELRVFKSNHAKKLYEKLGFKQIDEIETHYILRKEKIQ